MKSPWHSCGIISGGFFSESRKLPPLLGCSYFLVNAPLSHKDLFISVLYDL